MMAANVLQNAFAKPCVYSDSVKDFTLASRKHRRNVTRHETVHNRRRRRNIQTKKRDGPETDGNTYTRLMIDSIPKDIAENIQITMT